MGGKNHSTKNLQACNFVEIPFLQVTTFFIFYCATNLTLYSELVIYYLKVNYITEIMQCCNIDLLNNILII